MATNPEFYQNGSVAMTKREILSVTEGQLCCLDFGFWKQPEKKWMLSWWWWIEWHHGVVNNCWTLEWFYSLSWTLPSHFHVLGSLDLDNTIQMLFRHVNHLVSTLMCKQLPSSTITSETLPFSSCLYALIILTKASSFQNFLLRTLTFSWP